MSYKSINEIWSLVPARSGSKRFKNKNLKKINKLSLVARAILHSKKSKRINRVFLSTDSIRIKKEGLKYGAEVPFLRTKKNSQDYSNDYDVIKEFLIRFYQKQKIVPKYLVLMRPTTPLRRSSIIDLAIKKFKDLKNYDSLISVQEMNEPIHKKFFIVNNKLKTVNKNLSLDQANNPRQGFKKSYSGNGYFDIIKTQNILSKNCYLGSHCYPFVTHKTIDIDEKIDFEIAKFLETKKNLNV